MWAEDADFPFIDNRHYLVHCRYVQMASHLPLVHVAESRRPQVHLSPEGWGTHANTLRSISIQLAKIVGGVIYDDTPLPFPSSGVFEVTVSNNINSAQEILKGVIILIIILFFAFSL